MYHFFVEVLPMWTCVVWIYMLGNSNKMLKLGRSKNGYKKLKKTLSIWDWISKRKHLKLTKTAITFQYFFIINTYLWYFLLITFVFIFAVSRFTGNFYELIKPYLLLKCYLVEIPLLIIEIMNIRRPKNGVGLEWKIFIENNL